MKKLILVCFSLFLVIALWPGQARSNSGSYTLSKQEVPQDDAKAAKKSKHKSSKKDKEASDTVSIDLGSSKNGKDMTDKKGKTLTYKGDSKTPDKQPASGKSSSQHPSTQHPATQHTTTQSHTTSGTQAKPGKEAPAPEGVSEVVSLYNSLPLEDLPELQKYAGEKKYKDDPDYRKSWIKTKDENRGFIVLQLPATDRYTKIQLYKTSAGTPLFVVETNQCNPSCSNFLRVYRQDADKWVDVTEETMPKLDNKFITGKLKQAYKKQYDDLDIYKSKGYDNDDNLQKALIYDISPDAKKIVVREQYLPLNLYEITWDGKDKFVLKKLGE